MAAIQGRAVVPGPYARFIRHFSDKNTMFSVNRAKHLSAFLFHPRIW